MVAKSIVLLGKSGRMMVIDPSASHLAYCIADFDLVTQISTPIKSGMIWCKDKWSRGQRFSFVDDAINSLIKTIGISDIYTEGFFVNPKLPFGAGVIPTINGIIEMNCFRTNANYLQEIPPPTWRSTLTIKAVFNGKKKDFKIPTKDFVESKLGKLPLTVKHNITGKEKKTPYDVSDCLAIYLAICKDNNLTVKVDDFAAIFK